MQFQKLGICFSGGGGKGAYQIGVWKALRDFGYESDIAAISLRERLLLTHWLRILKINLIRFVRK